MALEAGDISGYRVSNQNAQMRFCAPNSLQPAETEAHLGVIQTLSFIWDFTQPGTFSQQEIVKQ